MDQRYGLALWIPWRISRRNPDYGPMNRPKPESRSSKQTASDKKCTSPTPAQNTVFSGLSSFLKQTGIALKLFQRGGNVLLRSREALGPVGFAHLLMGTWAILGATVTVLDLGIAEFLERRTQTFFFQLRGPLLPPDDVVILAIDEPSLNQKQFYQSDPSELAHLEPLSQWPWQRAAYAIAIERLMAAGAQAVAIDLIFDSPSIWGDEDDARLRQAMEAYAGRVALASSFEDQPLFEGQGTLTQLIEPIDLYRTDAVHLGFINYWIDVDGAIHELSHLFPEQFATLYPDQEDYFRALGESIISFDEATLAAAQIDYAPPQGNGIFFYGPSKTFEHHSFWTVIEPETWQRHFKEDRFRDKIVLIGPTASLFQDLHETPFGKLAGVEIHANAIATLLSQRAIADALPNRYLQGLFIIIITVGSGIVIGQPRRLTHRTMRTVGFLFLWGMLSFIVFVGGRLIVPTAVPMVAIAFSGVSYVVAGMVREKLHRLQLRRTLKQYASSPIIQEIISKQDDLRDLLQERDLETLGKMLAGRYQLVEILGSGGFGETYIAADLQRPGQPLCVVKQLRPVTNDLKLFRLSQRLFKREAEILERLGNHDQIPQLLAYFEEAQEFYLVEEFIDGHPLRQELLPGQAMPEPKIVEVLTNILLILDFIHACGVIHRDIKPSNIIRRRTDQKLVLIDFGAVKETQAQVVDDQTQLQTVGIGTKGYMPSEQSAGSPRFNSDIYALGVIGIQALTGRPPDRLDEDEQTGELIWKTKASASAELESILTRMTKYSFRDRYQSTREVLNDLEVLLHRYGLNHLLDAMQNLGSVVEHHVSSLLNHISFSEMDDDDLGNAEDSTLIWASSMQSDPPSEES